MEEEMVNGKAKGGIERAKRMTPTERSEIAKRAADTRWNEDLLQAVCSSEDKPLRIADMEIDCYVLEDGTRVLSQASFLGALGRHRKANVRSYEQVPPILQSKALRPYISEATLEKSRPVTFWTPSGSRASGYRADLLPEVCRIYLKARDANTLAHNQQHVARQADILLRGLSDLGIIGLVDEATGYQNLRAQNALSKILEDFIAKELQPWVKTFPDDFYRELFRLRGMDYPSGPVRRPQYFGAITNDIVYKRLAPGVLDELKKVTPRAESGRPKNRLFQRLTTNIGYPKLREHLGSVVTIMKLSNGWHNFIETIDQLHPRYNGQLSLPFRYDADEDDGQGL